MQWIYIQLIVHCLEGWVVFGQGVLMAMKFGFVEDCIAINGSVMWVKGI